MADAASTAAVIQSLAAASTSLRDTAKWLVGGVAATAAGVFAGSSLTNLGSLDPADDAPRLLLALGGATIGFLALAELAWRALSVLTIRAVSFAELVEEREGKSKGVVAALTARHTGSLPGSAASLVELRDKILVENAKNDAQRDPVFTAEAQAFLPILMAEGGFERVALEFERMKRVLPVRLFAAIVGFGLFAWAANPPSPAPPPPLLVVQAR